MAKTEESYFYQLEQPDFPNAECTARPDLPWVPDPDTPRFITEMTRQICEACVHMDECRLFALVHPHIKGMWGGTSTRDRERVRQGLRRKMEPSRL